METRGGGNIGLVSGRRGFSRDVSLEQGCGDGVPAKAELSTYPPTGATPRTVNNKNSAPGNLSGDAFFLS